MYIIKYLAKFIAVTRIEDTGYGGKTGSIPEGGTVGRVGRHSLCVRDIHLLLVKFDYETYITLNKTIISCNILAYLLYFIE